VQAHRHQPGHDTAAKPSAAHPHRRHLVRHLRRCAVFLVLIVLMLQNTRTDQVSFVGMHGNLPLALALLIAAVAPRS